MTETLILAALISSIMMVTLVILLYLCIDFKLNLDLKRQEKLMLIEQRKYYQDINQRSIERHQIIKNISEEI